MEKKPLVLYVDDEIDNLVGFEASFSKEYEILTADNTHAAYQLLKQHKVQIMLVDYRLGNIDGLSFVKEIKI